MATIRRSLFAGEVLYRQGEAADCAWLIESGAIVCKFWLHISPDEQLRQCHHRDTRRDEIAEPAAAK